MSFLGITLAGLRGRLFAALLAVVPSGLWAGGKLNVLFITCDDLNTDLGAYGHPQVCTPHIDALAARGVRFDQAFAQWPGCLPSRYSLLSGWTVPRTGIRDFKAMSRTGPLQAAVYLPQHFKSQGYTTVRLDKIFHIGGDDAASWTVSEEPLQLTGGPMVANWTGIELAALGLDGVHDKWLGGPTGYGNPVIESGRFPDVAGEKGTYSVLHDAVPEELLFDGNTAARAVHHLERFAASGEPFFLGVGFRRPHLPFIAQKRYFDLYPPESIALPPPQPGYTKTFSDDDHRKLMRGYYAAVSFADAQVGKVLAALERTGLADRTIVVLLGDHGYALGERDGWFSKGQLWDRALRTALIVAAPRGTAQAGAVGQVVSLTDLYPTLVELAGLPAPATSLDGVSLVPLLVAGDDAETGESVAHDFRPGWKELGASIRTSHHRYTELGDGTVELFDTNRDPFGWHNLAGDPTLAPLRAELSARLRRTLKPVAAPAEHSLSP
jgi:uncharacterized sulfatase